MLQQSHAVQAALSAEACAQLRYAMVMQAAKLAYWL
jgi:hypothetical protein